MNDLMKLIKKIKLVSVKTVDLNGAKGKESYTDMVEYYIHQLYKFVLAYKQIFEHLIHKEGLLKRIK